MVKVFAPVGDLAMSGSHSLPPPYPVLRTTLGARQPLLGRGQAVRRSTSPAWIVDLLTVAGRGETHDADIDPDLAPGRRQRIRRDITTGQHQHPAPPLAFNLDRLDPALHLPVQIDFDLADTSQIHPLGLMQPTAPSPSLGHSTLSNLAVPLNRG